MIENADRTKRKKNDKPKKIKIAIALKKRIIKTCLLFALCYHFLKIILVRVTEKTFFLVSKTRDKPPASLRYRCNNLVNAGLNAILALTQT